MPVIAKKTAKNQITLPKKIAVQFPDCDYFEVSAEEGRIVLRPVRPDGLRRVQQRLEELGIVEGDVAAAVKWARERSG
jgi:hypothetical protein